MSQYVDEEIANLPVEEFDLSDPSLAAYVPDINTENVPKQIRPAPPDDGHHWVRVRLNEKRQGPPVYIKGTRDPRTGKILDARVVLALSVRIVTPEGNETAYLKDWYPSSTVMKGATGSQVTAIAFLADKPVKRGASVQEIAAHMERIFAEAGEDGITLLVKTRWVKSVPKVDEHGMYVYKGNSEIKEYVETKGQEKIIKSAVLEAKAQVATWEQKPDENIQDFYARKQAYIDEAPSRAHLFQEPVTGEDRTVGAEVQELLDHTTMELD